MRDGLYQVETPYLCAGFIVEGGELTECAPILQRKIRYWMTKGVRIMDPWEQMSTTWLEERSTPADKERAKEVLDRRQKEEDERQRK